MNDEEAQSIAPEHDLLARFVMDARWIRSSDRTIKPDAFMPHPTFLDVSVTRHAGLTDRQIWGAGEKIAARRFKALLGRADLESDIVTRQALEISQAPTPENPNHAVISGWPADKPAQKIIALELAAASVFRSYAPKAP